MNWFTKLFSQRTKNIPPEKKTDIAPHTCPNNPLACSEEPVSIEHKKLSPATLKKLVPLRDMDDALLASLIADIGTIPILHFAEQNPNEYPNLDVLGSAIPFLSPPVGSLVLHTLGFTPELAGIPQYAEDWFYKSESDRLNLVNTVLLAKLHSYFGTHRTREIPYLNSIPAYTKLKNSKIIPTFRWIYCTKPSIASLQP